ncbi:MAG: hypothetical protein WCS09_09335 [Pseudomonadota bacterium]
MDRFQRKSLVLAVAGAFGGLLATGAVAQVTPLAETAATLTGATVVRISGASAQDLGLRNVMRRICLPGTMTQYTLSNQNAYLCAPNSSQVSGVTGNLLVLKSSVGGSANGVGPVASSATNLAFINMSAVFANLAVCGNAVVTNATAPVSPDTIGLPAFQTRTCATAPTQTGTAPDAGLADVEPALLGATVAQIAALNAKGTNQLVFGIPVTLTMYKGLQLAQGLGDGVTVNNSAANVPSLSRAQIANIFAGNIVDSSQLSGPDGVALPSNPLVVAQRVSTSGSQAITEVFFLNRRCTPTGVAFADPEVTYTVDATAYAGCRDSDASAPFRAANSGSGQVLQCLLGADKSSRWGIGLLSTESVPSTTSTDGQFRYIRVDGALPSLLDAALGNYTFVAEQSMQWKTTFTLASAPTKFPVANYIRTNLGNPTVIKALNSSFVQTYGQAGLLGVPNGVDNLPAELPLTAANVTATPVNTWSKSFSTALSNCTMPQIVNQQQTFPN